MAAGEGERAPFWVDAVTVKLVVAVVGMFGASFLAAMDQLGTTP